MKVGGDRNPRHLGESRERLGGAGASSAVARQNDRPLCASDQTRCSLDLRRVGACGMPGPFEKRLGLDGSRKPFDILRDRQIRVAGALRLRDIERLADHFRRRGWSQQNVGPLGERLVHGKDIHNLVRLLVDSVDAHLRRDGHERRRIRLGVGHAKREVDGSRPERRRADTGLAGDAAVDVRHECGGLRAA